MSFAEGFAKAFVPGLQQGANLILQGEMELFRESMKDFKNEKNKYTKASLEDRKVEQQAIALVKETPGIPASAVPAVYNSLRAGRSAEAIRRDLVEGGITAARPSSSTSKPASTPTATPVDAQMSEAGLAGDPKVTPASVQGGSEPTKNEDGSVSFNFTKWMNQRREDAVGKAANMTPEQVKTIKSGYTPQVKESEVAIVPRPVKGKGTGESAVLTAGRVAAELAGFEQRAAGGDPAAVKALENYKNGPFKIKMNALNSTRAPKGTSDFVQAFVDLEDANASGDPAKIEAATKRFSVIRDANVMKDQLGESGKPVQLYKIENGKPVFEEATAKPGASGDMQYIGSDGKPLTGQWKRIGKDQDDTVNRIYSANQSEINKYQQSMASVAGALRLGKEAIDIVNEDPRVLTAVAGGVRQAVGIAREVGTGMSVLKDIFGKNPGATVNLERFETELRNSGALGADQKLSDVEKMDLSKVTDLATRRSLLEAKLILLTFRAGGLEGQAGNAMSNKDFDRLTKIVDSSTNGDTFSKNLTGYLRGRVSSVQDMEQQLNDRTTGLAGEFQNRYGYSPLAKHVIPIDEFVQKNRDPLLKQGYELVTGQRVDSRAAPTQAPRTQAAPPATNVTQGAGPQTGATPPAPAQPTQPKAPTTVNIKRGEVPQVKGIPPTVKFVEIDAQGRAIYQDESGKKFTDRRFTYSFQD